MYEQSHTEQILRVILYEYIPQPQGASVQVFHIHWNGLSLTQKTQGLKGWKFEKVRLRKCSLLVEMPKAGNTEYKLFITNKPKLPSNYLTQLDYFLDKAYRGHHFFYVLFCEANEGFTINIVF